MYRAKIAANGSPWSREADDGTWGPIDSRLASSPVTHRTTRAPYRIASLVRPIAARSSAATGGSGAVPWAETIRERSNLSSASLCKAVSTERATICTPPARLAVGATSSVTADGLDPAGRGDLGDDRGRRRLARLEHADDHARDRLAIADHVVDRLGAGRGPHRARAHREELPLLDRPAGVLAGQARPDRVVGDDLDHRHRAAVDLAGHDRDLGQVAQADPRQLDAGEQAAPGLDPAVDVPAASFDRVDGDPPDHPGRTTRRSTSEAALALRVIVMLLSAPDGLE